MRRNHGPFGTNLFSRTGRGSSPRGPGQRRRSLQLVSGMFRGQYARAAARRRVVRGFLPKSPASRRQRRPYTSQVRASGCGPVARTGCTGKARRHHRGQHPALASGSLADTAISVWPEVLEPGVDQAGCNVLNPYSAQPTRPRSAWPRALHDPPVASPSMQGHRECKDLVLILVGADNARFPSSREFSQVRGHIYWAPAIGLEPITCRLTEVVLRLRASLGCGHRQPASPA